MRRSTALTVMLLALSLCWVKPSYALVVNLEDFSADPSVTVTPGGGSATFAEDAALNPVLLYNDSYDIPLNALALKLDYFLEVEPGGEDYFDIYLNDLTAPAYSYGGPEGTYQDTLSLDITAFKGLQIPVYFSFFDVDYTGLDSVLTLSGIEITQETNPVPEPATMVLVGGGLLGLARFGRKRNRT